MKLNFAKSEITIDDDGEKLTISDTFFNKTVSLNHKHTPEISLILDIQDALMNVFGVWSIDVYNFDKIKQYVRELKKGVYDI